MEDPGTSGPESVASPPGGAPKSKLDTLSKEDLIKFTKKQMAAMQKMKAKCADFEKEVETLKQQVKSSNNSSEDSILIQELTERMDALLLEKAETQQSLVLSRKELERSKLQAKDVAALQAELVSVKEDHQRKIRALESSIEESNIRHRDEVARFQNLLTEREQRDREEASEREERAPHQRQRADGHLEAELQSLRAQLELIQEGKSREVSELQESHQQELTEAQQEVENLREELAQRKMQHEEEMRALEEDCEVERERLLLLHDELTEQLALKDSYLQDVQEEDEDPARGSGIARMLELSRSSQGAPGSGDAEALEDLQAQNTMFQDELTLLSNVKAELEAELHRTREEFQTEREELEFKIDELQMCREGDHAAATAATAATAASDPASFDPAVSPADPDRKDSVKEDRLAEQKTLGETPVEEQNPTGETPTSITVEDQSAPSHHDQDQQKKSSGPEGQQKLQELRAQCEALAGERDSALAEHRHTLEVLRGLETELGGVTAGEDLVCRYKAVKEEGAGALRDLQEKIRDLGQERDGLVDRVREITEETTNLTEKIQALELKLEGSLGETRAAEDLKRKLRASIEEQETLAGELKASVDELAGRNEEILSQLQTKETLAQELEEMVGTLTTERDRTQSQLRLREDEVDRLNRLREEKEKEVEEKIKEMSSEKVDLVQKAEEASAALSLAQGERQRLDSELAALGLRLEQENLEKRDLEARLNGLSEEAQRARASVRALEEEEALRSSADDVRDLRARVEELESERDLLKSSLEEAQGRGRLDEMPPELQARMEELQKEKSLLEGELEEVVGDTEALQKDLEDMKTANEKLRAENQELQAKVALAVQDKEEEEEEEEEKEGTKEQEREKERRMRELEEQLTEKEALIVQLRSEMAALQAAPSEEDVASQFTEKIALLEKELKEKNERMNKIKAVAVKAKKELDGSKKEVASLKEEVESLKVARERVSSSMKDIIHGAEDYKNMQMDYDRQTEQLDKQREMAEAAERQIAELTKRLSTAVTQNETLFGEKQDLLTGMDTMRSTVRQLEAQCQELHRHTAGLDRDLLAERTTRNHKTKELSLSMKEVEELTARLRKQQQQSQQKDQELEQLRKEAQQSSLMDLEMADYVQLVEKLNADMSDKDACVEELKAQIHTHTQRENTLQQDVEGLKSQLDQGEEKMSKMKQLLVKTKKDLADAKKQESSHMVLQASLKGELEANLQQLESSKIQLCEVTAECHRLQEQLRCVTEQQHRSSSSLQQCISSLQQECDTAKAELTSTTAEFESYKVRVHNVLKQQKNKSSSQSDGEPGKLEREQLSGQLEQLRSRLSESQQGLQSSAAELQQLHGEHDTLLDRHNKMLQENICKEAELRERLLAVQSENVSLRSEQAQVQAELQGQAEAQRQAFREQVRRLQDEHRATVDTLQGQLGRLEEQLFTMQNHNGSGQVQSARKALLLSSDPQQQRSGSRNPAEQSPAGGLGFMSMGDLQSMAREEGEGMETTETERSSPAHTPLPSLEQLLTSPDPKQEPFVWALEPTKEELSHKLTTATRSMEHMNSLLHETEATNAVLMEQITLLKSEVRRLERNQEREKSVANLEYLKNVLLQFIFLHSGSERQALLPVIHTMLQLSPEEKSKLAAIAHGEEETSGSRGSGWSSYLHSWSGIR